MEEELLRQILQEIQSQAGTSWQDVLLLMIPSLVGLVVGISGAAVAIYTVKRSSDAQLEALRLATESDFEKISFERRLEWRRERYLELQNALAEFVGALDKMLAAKLRHAISVFHGDTYNEEPYLAAYGKCVEEFETVRSSGRLNERRLNIGDKQIGDLVLTLSVNADTQYVAMLRSVAEATAAFKKAGNPPGSDDRFWAEEQRNQRSDIADRTHQISEMIEERISLPS